MSIDIFATDEDIVLTLAPDPKREGYVEIEFDGADGGKRLGSFKIRDLLIILHATAGTSHQPERTRSRPPIWMRENR